MEFWIGLVSFVFLVTLLEIFAPRNISKILLYVIFATLWFFSAFRYMIGWDYESYIKLFNNVTFDAIFQEISFVIISVYLRENGFDFQSLFILYTTITFVFLLIGLKKYTNSNYSYMLLSLYIFLCTPILYWDFFSIIRQGVAASIFFVCSQYIVSRNFMKFFIGILFATFWHYSAIILLLCYWICNKNVKTIYYLIGVILAIIISISNVLPILLMSMLNEVGMYTEYANELQVNFSSGATAIFSLVMYVILLVFRDRNSNYENMLYNMSFISIVFIFLLSFSIPIYRMRVYFEIFNILLLPLVLLKIKNKNKNKNYFVYVILIPYAIWFLSYVHSLSISEFGIAHSFFSANNIEYMFNFKIFK